MRLIDADAYAKEMWKRQDACEAAINAEDYEGETFSLRQHWEGVFAAFVEAKLTLDSMPTVEMPGWISVQDRLPERGNTCLVWLRGGGMTFMVFDGSRFIGGSAYSDDRITHWMLLPGAPEEVST